MTPQERQELDKATDRAAAHNVHVIATGRFKAGGDPFYLVNSVSQPGTSHVVRQVGFRLVCDCEAGRRRRICMHRAAAHIYVAMQAERKRREADGVEQALRGEATDEAARRDSAVLHRGNHPITFLKH